MAQKGHSFSPVLVWQGSYQVCHSTPNSPLSVALWTTSHLNRTASTHQQLHHLHAKWHLPGWWHWGRLVLRSNCNKIPCSSQGGTELCSIEITIPIFYCQQHSPVLTNSCCPHQSVDASLHFLSAIVSSVCLFAFFFDSLVQKMQRKIRFGNFLSELKSNPLSCTKGHKFEKKSTNVWDAS